MYRTAARLLAASALVLALAAGVALADTIACTANPCNGTEGDDEITGRETAGDIINAFGGADMVDGKGNGDTIRGGEGNDLRLSGDAGDDEVYGGPGGDLHLR